MKIIRIILEKWKYILLGIVVLGLVIFITPKFQKKQIYEREVVEVKVTGKEITTINRETLYLIYTVDRNGHAETFEISNSGLKGRSLDASEVYEEFRKGKHYQFTVSEKAEFNSYYRVVCAAARLIGGFTEETSSAASK